MGALVAMGPGIAQAQEPPPPEPKLVLVLGLTPMYGENPYANGLAMIEFVPYP